MDDTIRFETFSLLTGKALKSIARIKQARMGEFQLSAANTNCMLKLLAQDALTQGELAGLEGMDRSQVCRVLRELAARGYVSTDGQQGYKRRYALTPSGIQTAQAIRRITLSIHQEVSGDIPDEDIEVFYRTLRTISKNLEIAEKKHAGKACTPTES